MLNIESNIDTLFMGVSWSNVSQVLIVGFPLADSSGNPTMPGPAIAKVRLTFGLMAA